MPRQNRRRERDPLRPLSGSATERVEWRGRDYLVRHVAGASATKNYRCPGCDQEIQPGTPHVVVWPDEGGVDGAGGAPDRRHWHNPCWAARDTRAPTRR